MAVKISIDRSRVAARIKAGKMAMVSAVAEQALSDCNYFAKRDQGTLLGHITSWDSDITPRILQFKYSSFFVIEFSLAALYTSLIHTGYCSLLRVVAARDSQSRHPTA